MTTALATSRPLDLLVGDNLTAAGYSAKEINLIGYCWQDCAQINTKKNALALHLYELKQEMDNGDNGAGAGCVKSRFWAAFEAGHLPLQGDAGRNSVKTALQAASWLAERESADSSANSFHALAPSTIVEISNLEEPQQALVFKAIESSDFIGIAAVRLLARETRDEMIERLFSWVANNKGTAITPRVIGTLAKQLVQENEPAATQMVDVAPVDDDEQERIAAFRDTMAGIRATAPERKAKVEAQGVRDELSRAEREHRHLLDEQVRAYNARLHAASKSIHDLLSYLENLSRIHGTNLLGEMRCIDVMGMITVSDDMARLKEMGQELMEAVNLARSLAPSTGINMTTIDA